MLKWQLFEEGAGCPPYDAASVTLRGTEHKVTVYLRSDQITVIDRAVLLHIDNMGEDGWLQTAIDRLSELFHPADVLAILRQWAVWNSDKRLEAASSEPPADAAPAAPGPQIEVCTTELTRYEVRVSGLEGEAIKPLFTFDAEEAEEAVRVLTEAKADGRLALVTSDQGVFGRDGVAYEGQTRFREGYGSKWDFGYPPTDTVKKLIERCRQLKTHLSYRPDAKLALHYAREGQVEKVGSYVGWYYDGPDDIVGYRMAVAATSLEEARTFVVQLRPDWASSPNRLRVHPL